MPQWDFLNFLAQTSPALATHDVSGELAPTRTGLPHVQPTIWLSVLISSHVCTFDQIPGARNGTMQEL